MLVCTHCPFIMVSRLRVSRIISVKSEIYIVIPIPWMNAQVGNMMSMPKVD